jgi:hypothetical protein
MPDVFTVEERERVRDRILELAARDERVVAGAVVGSLAAGGGDRWSDLDLTFAVADGATVAEVLVDWTRRIVGEHAGVPLFDVASGGATYRVFLLPGCLQLDLSFAPASSFGAAGPRFRLLFGEAVEKQHVAPPDPEELLGQAVHHALRARFCIERGRRLQAEYWISAVRDTALALACRARSLPAAYGRGFDDLPVDVRDGFDDGLVHSLDREELLRALAAAVNGLLHEAGGAGELAARVEPALRALTQPWDP